MLIPTSNFLTTQADKKTSQTINSIKIDFSKLSFIPKTQSQFTNCNHCGAILIEQDGHNQIQKNEKFEYIWSCRFCKKQNISKQMYFACNNYKFPIEKNLKSKITPPIILFVIDNSGSMSQSIFSNIKFGNNPQVISQTKKSLSSKFNDILTQSKLYQQQKKQISKIQKNYTNLIKSTKYSEEQISKLTFLYAMIEYNLKNITKKQKKVDARVGFIFFSDMIYVLKAAKQKEIPVYIQDGQLCHQEWPYKKQIAQFYEFDSLYQKGKSYQKYFGDSRLANLDVSKVAINKVKGAGRTALGPALALAMGIISVHDQGSRIIMVTDSMPNFGILSMGDSQHIYKRIGLCLQENGATLSILKWTGEQLTKNKQQDIFNEFRKSNLEYVDQIQLNLAKCKQNQGLQISIRTLNNLINREPMANSYNVKIFCDNSNIQSQKLANDQSDFKKLRFLSSNSKCWLSQIINKSQLQQYDYLFPIFTQIVITYDDIFTKQRYIFMSYTKQHLIKQKKIQNIHELQIQKEQSWLEQEETINIQNIQELCNMQMLSRYESLRRDQEYDAETDDLKTVFKYKTIQFEKDIHSINDIAAIKNQLYEQHSCSIGDFQQL